MTWQYWHTQLNTNDHRAIQLHLNQWAGDGWELHTTYVVVRAPHVAETHHFYWRKQAE